MLSIRAAKSPNALVTQALDWTKRLAMTQNFRNFVSKTDMLLEPKMHHRGQNTPGNGHPRVRKTPDLPDLRFSYDS